MLGLPKPGANLPAFQPNLEKAVEAPPAGKMSPPLQYDDAPSEEILWKDYYYETSGLNFNAFQLKIVMRSSNQARVPLIADLRAICLAT